jgi:hypothetical protein
MSAMQALRLIVAKAGRQSIGSIFQSRGGADAL